MIRRNCIIFYGTGRLLLALVLCLTLCLSGVAYAAAESAKAEELPNLFSADSVDGFFLEEDPEQPGTFISGGGMDALEGTEYFYIPDLTRNYTYSGHVKILAIDEPSYTGVRLVIGNNGAGRDMLLITKDWGVRFEFMGSNMNDALWDATRIRLAVDVEFDFKVILEGHTVSLELNGQPEGSIEIPEEFDAFDEGADNNLGISSYGCQFALSDVVITCADVKVQEPTEAPEPEATPEAGDSTEEPAGDKENTATKEPNDTVATSTKAPADSGEEDGGSSPLPYILGAVAVVIVVIVVIVIVNKKKRAS